MDAFLGIDTSCYTTSLCVVDSHFDVVADERIILTVPQGGRGLSQSNMVYQHMRNLPVLFERLAPQLESCAIRAVGVTDKPRRREDSYMPAFLAGLGYGRSLAAVLRVPMYTVSHQENHLLAALRATGCIGQEAFYGLHLSGGTTDLLKAVPDEMGLDIERVGGTSDISAGQFIDRIGVALGLPFPAGVHVDKWLRLRQFRLSRLAYGAGRGKSVFPARNRRDSGALPGATARLPKYAAGRWPRSGTACAACWTTRKTCSLSSP